MTDRQEDRAVPKGVLSALLVLVVATGVIGWRCPEAALSAFVLLGLLIFHVERPSWGEPPYGSRSFNSVKSIIMLAVFGFLIVRSYNWFGFGVAN